MRLPKSVTTLAFTIAYAFWAIVGYPLPMLGQAPATDSNASPLVLAGIAGTSARVGIRTAAAMPQTARDDSRVQQLTQQIVDPWAKGVVLDYLFFTANEPERAAATQFVTTFSLTPAQVGAIKQVALGARHEKAALVRPSMQHILDAGTRADQRFRAVVGPKYDAMRAWLHDWFVSNAAMRLQQQLDLRTQRRASTPPNAVASLFGSVAAAADFTGPGQVYATQVGVAGWDIALPDWGLKCANLGLTGCPANYQAGTSYPPPYFATVKYPSTGIQMAPYAKEVGPWNENDNYWDSAVSYAYNPRRCNPSPGTGYDGVPEAELAILFNFNEGMSCQLKTGGGYQAVGNEGGVDLDDDLRAALGICYLCNVWVEMTWYALP